MSTDEQVRQILAGMNTEQKLAQMMIVAFRSDANNTRNAVELTQPYRELLEKYDFGGLILFRGNIVDMDQTVALIRDCQEAAMNSPQGIPMLISVDQEGGLINRVPFGISSSGNMSLAATGDPALTEESADMIGQEIRALGFNLDFAPVSDVNNNPNNPVIGTRSFSDDPEIAAQHVAAFFRGLDKNGIIATLKHFPGHGNVGEDSHTHLPLSELTLEELKNVELIPFQRGIDAGAEMIMTAHIQYPNIETNTYISKLDGKTVSLPATLSHTILTDLLREDMGFDGVIVTDSMDMDAIAAHFDEIDAAVLAINAGVDMLTCPVNLYQDDEIDTFPAMDAYMQALLARVEAGEIREETLDEAVARILKLKIEKGILPGEQPGSLEDQLKRAESVVGSAEHHIREWEIAQQGMTLLKNEGNMLPLDGKNDKEILILIPNEARRPSVEYALARLESEGLLEDADEDVTVLCYSGPDPEDEALQDALEDAETVLVLSQSAEKNELISRVIGQVHQSENGRAALLSLKLPYDAACYEDADAVLCAYNPSGSAHDAEGKGPFNLNVAAALCMVFGQSEPQGTLPVNIPKLQMSADGETVYSDELLYERGSGISYN